MDTFLVFLFNVSTFLHESCFVITFEFWINASSKQRGKGLYWMFFLEA
jgi:hypothetical protein